MAKQFRRLNRQESISRFAKRHGFDIQENAIDPSRSVSNKSVDRATENKVDKNYQLKS
jgi:hypothetical protein